MKKTCLSLLLILTLFSCKNEIAPEEIAKINGYWEIREVVLANGEKKDYKVNPIVDYFEVKGNAGIRKKVTPQMDGSYRDNAQPEKLEVVQSDGKTYLQYDSGYGKWKEEIVSVADSTLVLKNESDIEYRYKKAIPFGKK